MYTDLPAFAAWRFVGAVDGFEVVYAEPGRLRGHTSAVEDGHAYAVHYEIEFDDAWRTRRARIAGDSVAGTRQVELTSDGHGSWTVDGVQASHLNGLVDIDLEASACTNTLPVHRMRIATDEATPAPAAYVRALDLSVRRLEQSYRLLDERRFDYSSEDGFTALLEYDSSGLLVHYPGIAERFA